MPFLGVGESSSGSTEGIYDRCFGVHQRSLGGIPWNCREYFAVATERVCDLGPAEAGPPGPDCHRGLIGRGEVGAVSGTSLGSAELAWLRGRGS